MSHPDPLHNPENVLVEDVAEPADINEARITGHVVTEPKMKLTNTGHQIATLIVQTLRSFNASGRRKESVEHHLVVAWDGVVERVRQLKPGNRISVFGRLQTHSWNDKVTGVKQRKTEIVAENVILHH